MLVIQALSLFRHKVHHKRMPPEASEQITNDLPAHPSNRIKHPQYFIKFFNLHLHWGSQPAGLRRG
jgi:hypothetical protein